MARGGYEKRRIQAKRDKEREQRKRARRNRMLMRAGVIVAIVALVGGIVLIAATGGGDTLATEPTPTTSPPATEATFADPCTEAGPETLGVKSFDNPPCKVIDESKSYAAIFTTTRGTIEVKLLAQAAPVTVNNFVFLARNGFYDGSIFHRVIKDFAGTQMIQGGDAVNADGTGDPGYSFGDENPRAFDAPGFLAMANSGPGTNGSQFFILTGPVQHLNAPGSCPGPQGCHTVFGEVTKGMKVAREIAGVRTDERDKPRKDVVLKSVVIREGSEAA